jgi:hypothetical protein
MTRLRALFALTFLSIGLTGTLAYGADRGRMILRSFDHVDKLLRAQIAMIQLLSGNASSIKASAQSQYRATSASS